jgi:hypothetical protein
MGRSLLGLTLVLCACKASIGDGPADDAGLGDAIDASTIDAPPDALVLGAWGPPAKVPGASTTAIEDDGSLSSTTLELVFAIVDAADANRKDLYIQTRPSPTGTWTTPQKLPFSLTGSSEETPRFTGDDLTLFFASDRAGGAGGLDIYKVTRATIGGAWSTPALVPGVNTAANEKWLAPCGGSRYLLVVGGDLAEGTLGGGAPTIVAPLSSTANEIGAFLTQDCLTAYFASAVSGTLQLYTSTRTAVTAAWPSPAAVTDFTALGGAQEDPWVSPDNRTFALVSNISGSKDVYLSTR